MFDFLNTLPEYMQPYILFLGVALTLGVGSMVWYGIYEWHHHATMKARQKRRQLRL